MAFRFTHDDRGAIAIITAAAMTALMAVAALAVDVGMLYLERRHAQGAVDLAAMAAASNVANAQAAAEKVLIANDITGYNRLTVVTGNYSPDPTIAPENRFRPNAAPVNAVRVDLVKTGRTYFAQIFAPAPLDIGVTGIAANGDVAAFSAGSRLLAIRDGVTNQFLGALLGTNLSLSLADYEALLDATVSIAPFLAALNIEADMKAATYNDVITGEATLGDVVGAAAQIANDNGDTRAATALQAMERALASKETPIDGGKLFDLGPAGNAAIGTKAPGLDATFSALDLITNSAVVANEKNQVAVDLGASVPGLASVKLDIAIGEPPVRSAWISVGQPGSTVHTAQIRIRLIAEVAGSGLLAGATVRVPLYIEAAHASARLAAIRCEPSRSVSVAARPGVVSMHLADVTGFGATAAKPTVQPARLVKLPLAEVYGSANVAIQNLRETELTFSEHDIATHTVKRAGTSDVTGSLVSTLLRRTKFEVQSLGLSLLPPVGLTGAVATVLAGAAAPLDGVVSTILTSLGVHLGEVDIRVHGIRCGGGGYLTG